MTDYDIRKIAKRGKGAQVTLPGIEESAGGKVAYLKALRAMLRELKAFAFGVSSEFDLQQLARLAVGLTSIASNTVRQVLDLEAQRHTNTFKATVKRALGIDLGAVVRQEDLADMLRMKAAQNAALIKGLSDDAVKRVSTTVYDNLVAGNSKEELRKALVEQFGFSDNRAKLIARNEMSSLNADLNRYRHEQAGITEYVWTTSRDERVRPRHRALDGKVYRYGEPTGAEGGLPPGKPIMCRCIAKAVVQF